MESLLKLLGTPLWAGKDGDVTLAKVVGLIAAFLLLFIAAKTIKHRLEARLLKKNRDPKAVYATVRLAEIAIWIFGILALLEMVGVGLSGAATVLAALGIGIGLGLQGLVNDVVGSLILLLERPIRVGDLIQMPEGQVGLVQSIGWRATRIRTLDRVEILIPNSNILSSDLINWTLSDPLTRLRCAFGVHYRSDPKMAREAAIAVAQRQPKIVEDPPPKVFFLDYGDSSLDFELRIWTQEPWERDRILSDIRFDLFEELSQRGIEIPYPQRDLHLRSGFPPAKQSDGEPGESPL